MNNNLYYKLSKIGFRVNYTQTTDKYIDIEKTLLEALYAIDSDSRMLGLIFSWLEVHGEYIVADKLFKEYKKLEKDLGECPWFTGLCSYMFSNGDRRFKKGLKKFLKPIWRSGAEKKVALKMDGAIDFLQEVNILVPSKHLRIRTEDIVTKDLLAKSNHQYRNRLIIGTNWRAEILTCIQRGFENPYQISKELDIAYASTRSVFKESHLILKYLK